MDGMSIGKGMLVRGVVDGHGMCRFVLCLNPENVLWVFILVNRVLEGF